jgi:hypothetical protein
MQYENVGASGHQNLVSPHIWVPTISSSIIVEISHYCTLENNFDGVYLEYSTDNGSTWNDIPLANFFLGNYAGITAGSNNSCSGSINKEMWSGSMNNIVTAFTLSLTGTWVQFRFVGTEDSSVGTGVYQLLNFTVFADSFSGGSGGSFANGNIYAQNNIYAGSNVLLGDLAEYFPVVGKAEKGDIISYINGEKDLFSVSTKEFDNNIIGVYSTNPTLTLNSPNNGIPVALSGRIPVNVIGKPIKKGDYLTASSIPGKAMKADQSCFTIGRSLEDFNGGNGKIICLVDTGWNNINTSNNQLSSNGLIRKGDKSLTINNLAIQKESKIFFTFKGNIGSRYWLENINDGSFEIQLEKPASSDVNFDYLIDNAKILVPFKEKNNYLSKNNFELKNKQKYSSPQKPYLTESIIPIQENSQEPPQVPDPTKGFIWTPDNGITESKTN